MGKSGAVSLRVPPLGKLHEKVDASRGKLNRQDAKFAKEARDEGSETGFLAPLSRVPSDWLGALGVLAVDLDPPSEPSDGPSPMEEPCR